MSVTFAPARISNTVLYAAEAAPLPEDGGKIFHVLGVQNTVQNLARARAKRPGRSEDNWDWESPHPAPSSRTAETNGNAIILPIPAKHGTMGAHSIIDASLVPSALRDIALAAEKTEASRDAARDQDVRRTRAFAAGVADGDVYTVLIVHAVQRAAEDSGFLRDLLREVPAERRPPLQTKLFAEHAKWYPQWPLAVCCFSNEIEMETMPIVLRYEPLKPELLFAPGLVGYDGGAPDWKETARLDHTVAFATQEMRRGVPVEYRDRALVSRGAAYERIRSLFEGFVIGKKYDGDAQNGDFVARVSDVREGKVDIKRLLPPGAPR